MGCLGCGDSLSIWMSYLTYELKGSFYNTKLLWSLDRGKTSDHFDIERTFEALKASFRGCTILRLKSHYFWKERFNGF